MNTLKRSFVAVKRNKMKSVTLFILLLTAFNLIGGALLISRALVQTLGYFYRKMPNQIVIMPEFGAFSLEELDKNEKLSYVETSRYLYISAVMGRDDISSSLTQIHDIMNYVLLVTAGICFLIIGFTFMLFLIDRRHEIGVYLSLGQSKVKIVIQFLAEILLITLPIFLLTLITGNRLATYINARLLRSLLSIKNRIAPQNVWQYTIQITETQVYAIQQIPLDTSTILIFLIALVLTVFLSILIPTVYLFRLNPKKIFM